MCLSSWWLVPDSDFSFVLAAGVCGFAVGACACLYGGFLAHAQKVLDKMHMMQ
jgi:hypothetical protein